MRYTQEIGHGSPALDVARTGAVDNDIVHFLFGVANGTEHGAVEPFMHTATGTHYRNKLWVVLAGCIPTGEAA